MDKQRILFLTSASRLTLFIILISLATSGLYYTKKYNDNTPTTATVIRHVSDRDTDGDTNFYLILSNDKYGEFDILVSATTWSKFKDGNQGTFNISEFDIRQNTWMNTVMFGTMFLIMLIIFYLVLSILYYINPNDNLIVFMRSQLREVNQRDVIRRFPDDPRMFPNSWPKKTVGA